jgi:hypothetical protein
MRPRTARFPARAAATIKLTHYPRQAGGSVWKAGFLVNGVIPIPVVPELAGPPAAVAAKRETGSRFFAGSIVRLETSSLQRVAFGMPAGYFFLPKAGAGVMLVGFQPKKS